RLRKRLDASLLFATVAWSFGLAAAILVTILGEPGRIVPSALALGVLGWLTLTIFGYAMKVAGFLAWQYARSIDPARTLTPLSAAIPIRLSRVALVTLALGVAGIALVSALAPSLRDYAAAIYLCGGVLYLTTMLKIVTPYVRRAD
ncbi:MAG TPA: hypothetical protein VGN11_01980, partial [Candidatus Baltobacteraceae bacterium]|nr:hypothetical protein [Candidatus Baltobacteraceae bacterium]